LGRKYFPSKKKPSKSRARKGRRETLLNKGDWKIPSDMGDSLQVKDALQGKKQSGEKIDGLGWKRKIGLVNGKRDFLRKGKIYRTLSRNDHCVGRQGVEKNSTQGHQRELATRRGRSVDRNVAQRL